VLCQITSSGASMSFSDRIVYTEIERRALAFWMRSGSRIREVAGVQLGFAEGCCGALMLGMLRWQPSKRSDLIRRNGLFVMHTNASTERTLRRARMHERGWGLREGVALVSDQKTLR
jgi:hypothetical protein